MKFRTEIKPLNYSDLIKYQSKILMFGSCFAENIGDRLMSDDFNVLVNPFGIAFNPVSILNQINGHNIEQKHFVEKGNQAVSLDYHSKYNGPSIDSLKRKITKDRQSIQAEIQSADILSFTFGTAWVYQFKETGQTIANCQKLPADLFNKQLLNLDAMVANYTALIHSVIDKNSKIKILLTVSPVRHLKDGLVKNNRSKALLLLLCHQLVEKFKDHVIYYPSYEIVMDDLRDYRFFSKDLLHPNDMAVDYIYAHFQKTFFSTETMTLNALISKYNRLLGHKPLNPSDLEKEVRANKLAELQTKINQLKPLP